MQNFVGKTKCIAGYMKVANYDLGLITIRHWRLVVLFELHLEFISSFYYSLNNQNKRGK